MIDQQTVTDSRIAALERRLHRTQATLILSFVATTATLMIGMHAAQPVQPANPQNQIAAKPDISDVIFTRKLVVVDDQGVQRVVIGQDPKDTQRRSRSAGISIHDKHGSERGGMSTFDDDSVVIALDAPRGVGHPMPDRLGLFVGADGGAHVMLLDNQTRAVVKLQSDGDGKGGVQVFKWDMEAKKIHVKTLTFDGAETSVINMNE